MPRSVRTADEFFNTASFSSPAPYNFGDAGHDIIPGPRNNVFHFSFHFSLARRFPIRDRGALEFRASIFNAFNHPNWGIPGPNPDFGPFFGKIYLGRAAADTIRSAYDF